MGFKDMLPALTMEFVGTMFLAFIIGAGGGVIGISTALVILVYAGGPVSGGCYNPAVALAATLNGALGEGKKDWKKFGFYCLAEFVGGFLGMVLGYLSRRDDRHIACIDFDEDKYNIIEGILMCFYWTTFLCYVVLATACTDEKKDNHYYGWCIGFALGVGLMGASVNGGGLNPAVSLGNVLGGSIVKPKDNKCASENWEHIWWRALVPFAGSVAAWGLHMLTNPKQYGAGKLEKFAPFAQEFFGTMFFVLAISMGAAGATDGALLNGTCLAIVIFCGGHVSGGQYNPAVSLGVWIRGKQPLKQFLIFSGLQLAGAFVGSLLGYIVTRYDNDNLADPDVPHPALFEEVGNTGLGETDKMAGFLGEFMVTYMLVLVVLLTATWDKVENNNYFGLAIGYVVVAGSYSVGANSTGGAFNPAVWFGTNLMQMIHGKSDDFGDIWVYWIAELLAGALAGFTFRFYTGVNEGVKLPTKVAPASS